MVLSRWESDPASATSAVIKSIALDNLNMFERSFLDAYCANSAMIKEMKVFITGIAGFLGSHLADSLLADGHQVIGIDNLLGGEIGNVPTSAEFHQTDCNDFEAVRRLSQGADLVYHCAATAYEGLSVFSPHVVTTECSVRFSFSIFSGGCQSSEAYRSLLVDEPLWRYQSAVQRRSIASTL